MTSAASAAAEPSVGPEAPLPAATVDPPLPDSDEPRSRPNYRGRAEAPPASQRLLWIPRVVLAPAYVASDMATRPIGLLATYAEKNRWRARIYDFFTFGADNQIGLFPSGRVDLGFRPSAGAYFFWNDIAGGSRVRARATSGGRDLWTADAAWRWPAAGGALTLAGHLSNRRDSAFYGLGGSSSAQAARFGERQLEVRLRYAQSIAPDLAVSLFVGYEDWLFDAAPEGAAGESLARAIELGRLPPPPGLQAGFTALVGGVRADFDGRRGRLVRNPRDASDYEHVSGSGFTLRPYAVGHAGLDRARAHETETAQVPAWLDYGLSASGTVDLTGTQRRLELELYGSFTDPLPGAAAVPFTHLATLGGAGRLRGFGPRRLLDRSAVAATLRYTWPVWTELDGSMHLAAGNVFGPHLAGFELPRLRASMGIGVTTAAVSDHPFEVLLAWGTEPLEAGASLLDVRFTAGTAANF